MKRADEPRTLGAKRHVRGLETKLEDQRVRVSDGFAMRESRHAN
jgi:hypothetical protein